MSRSLPPETEASSARRRYLSQRWETEKALAARLALPVDVIDAWRHAGKVLGVWFRDEDCYRYPDFQWRDDQLLEEMQPILAYLRKEMLQGEPTTGWEEVEWLVAPHSLLEGRPPADVLVEDPQRVLAIAKREFCEEADSNW